MKICIINGSHRKNGNCSIFSQKAASILNKKHEVEIYNLHDCNIIPCNGCLICEEGEDCPIKDDYSNTICPAIKACDLIIFATPTYFNMPSSLLVNLLDRTNNLCDYFSENKKHALVYLVGQTDDTSILEAYRCLKNYFEIMDIKEIMPPIIDIARMPQENFNSQIILMMENI